MPKFIIDNNVSVKEIEARDLDEAKKIAEDNMSSETCENVMIKDANGTPLAESLWWPHTPNPDEDFVLKEFPDGGFYEFWSDDLGDF